MDTILKLILSKGHYSAKIAHIYTHGNIIDDIKAIEQTLFSLETFKGHNFTKNEVGLQVLFSAHCVILVYFSTECRENIFDGF